MRRKISGITALILAVALVAVLPRFGFTQVGAALWSERPVTTTAPAPAASPWVELARTLKPAVVNISTKRVDKSNQSFEQFFGGRPRRAVRSLGSGFVINPNGLIVTNNHAIFSQSGGSVGIGFAIPVNLAKPVLTQLAAAGHVVRGYLGVAIQRMTSALAKGFNLRDAHGALVASVADGGPAKEAGLRPGDVIVEYDGHTIGRSDELPRLVAETRVGRDVALTVVRDGKTLTLRARIAKLAEPEEQRTAEAGGKPSLGLAVQTVTPQLAQELDLPAKAGVLVRGVEDGSPAASAGVQPGDVIAEIDRTPVGSVDDLERALARLKPGAPVLLFVRRNDGDLYIAVAS